MNKIRFLVENRTIKVLNSHFNAIMISLTITLLMVLAYSVLGNNLIFSETNQDNSLSNYHSSKMPELNYYDDYESLRPTTKSAVVYPIFTQSAYEWGGIHDYYAGYCDSCISTQIQGQYEKTFASSGNGFRILEFLGYEVIDDIDIDKNPEILEKFDRVVLLHNEFVTKTEFDAITSHPNVIYLYPHALSSQVKTDYSKNSITLIRGPNYPDKNIINGFDWEHDNSEYFEDWSCLDWNFYSITNGFMLNCYPETELPQYGYNILKTINTL
jgi:hypothetical protein